MHELFKAKETECCDNADSALERNFFAIFSKKRFLLNLFKKEESLRGCILDLFKKKKQNVVRMLILLYDYIFYVNFKSFDQKFLLKDTTTGPIHYVV